jgi:hypothetical protein
MNSHSLMKIEERVTSGESAIEMPEVKRKKAKEFSIGVNASKYSLADINLKLCIYI